MPRKSSKRRTAGILYGSAWKCDGGYQNVGDLELLHSAVDLGSVRMTEDLVLGEGCVRQTGAKL